MIEKNRLLEEDGRRQQSFQFKPPDGYRDEFSEGFSVS
jgi:hypothetical protein